MLSFMFMQYTPKLWSTKLSQVGSVNEYFLKAILYTVSPTIDEASKV